MSKPMLMDLTATSPPHVWGTHADKPVNVEFEFHGVGTVRFAISDEQARSLIIALNKNQSKRRGVATGGDSRTDTSEPSSPPQVF